jgi:LemA protein
MSTAVWIILGIIVVIAISAIVMYNRFVAQRNLVRDSWANIDTELRRRYDLIPNIMETVKGYATHEQQTFENVTLARSAAQSAQGPEAQAQAENFLTAALRQLFAVAEAYPDLKANTNFLQMQNELANTEDRIQTARRFYNGNVRDYNQRVQSFPSMIIANMFNFKEEPFFEIDDEMREAGAPQVSFAQPAGGTPPAGGGATPPPAATPPATTPSATPPAAPAAPSDPSSPPA